MRSSWIVGTVTAAAVLTGLGTISAQEREMTVRQGPETVFDVPVEEIAPVLDSATATEVNGRVGPEFVFWGYTLANGDEAWLYACALVEGVDCVQRREAICDGPATVLVERADMGRAVDRECRSVALAGTGDLHPGCDDKLYTAPLNVGVVTCR
jgi:hypothetical protein